MRFKGFVFPKDMYFFILTPYKIFRTRRKVNRKGFNIILHNLEKNRFENSPDEVFLIKLKKYYKTLTFFLVRVFRDSNPCMIRSLVLYELCRKKKIKVSLVTGVQKNSGILTGHSWLEMEGIPFNENESYIDDFTIMTEV